MDTTDVITFIGILIFAGLIILLSNREVRRSLRHAKENQKDLEKERDSLEKRITERTQELVKAERARIQELERIAQFGELSQGLFHDLISPLTSMNLYVEKMDRSELDPIETKEVVKKMITASERMRSFMNSITHTLSLDKRSKESGVNLRDEVLIVRDLLAYKSRMAGVEINIVDVPKNVNLKASSLQIQQILMNLVANAIEAYEGYDANDADSGKRDVDIKVEVVDKYIELSVRDYGVGIKESDRERVFERSYSNKKGGSGLGLHTVKRIVEDELGGSVDFVNGNESGDNLAGTTFVVKIPT